MSTPAPRSRAQALVVASWTPFVAACLIALYVTVSGVRPMTAERGIAGAAAGVFFVVFALVVLSGCLGGLLFAFYGLAGRETLEADAEGLTLTRELLGRRVSRHHAAGEVRRIRLNEPAADAGNWATPPPRVVIDAGGSRQGFGSSLSAEDAARVVDALGRALGRTSEG